MSDEEGGGGFGCIAIAAVALLPAFVVSYFLQGWINDLHGEAAVGPALLWTLPVGIGIVVVLGLGLLLLRGGSD